MIEQLVTRTDRISAGTNSRRSITIHETDNTDAGATAQMHANLQSRGNDRLASWHIQVDDNGAIRSFPDTAICWHAGNLDGNKESIGVEICVNAGGDFERAKANAAQVVRELRRKYAIPRERVYQHHHWSGKDCPKNLRMSGWEKFLDATEDPMKYSPPVTADCRHLSGSEFGAIANIRGGRPHAGIDFQPPKPGQTNSPVFAITGGTVTSLFEHIKPGDKSNPLYEYHTGNHVTVTDDLGRVWLYQHGHNFKVKFGQRVEAGGHLCDMWNSGNTSGVHLHLGLRDKNSDKSKSTYPWVDPAPILRKNGVWPIGYVAPVNPQSSIIEKDTLTMADITDLQKAISAIPAKVLAHPVPVTRGGEQVTRSAGTLLSSHDNAINALLGIVTELAKRDGLTAEEVKEAAKAGAGEAIDEGFTIEGTATVELKGA